MPKVELATGEILEFPDGATDEQIGAAVDEYVAGLGNAPQSAPSPPGASTTAPGIPGASEPPLSQEGTFLDAIGQGLTLGFADEVGGALAGLGQVGANALGFGDGQTFGEAYTERRDQKRANAAGFAERNPISSFALNTVGGLAVPGLGVGGQAARGTLGLARAAGVGALTGGLGGIGSSDAETFDGVVEDATLGALTGGVTAGALKGAGDVLGAASSRVFGGPGVTNPTSARAAGQASKAASKAASKVASKAGRSGQAPRNSRYLQDVQALDDAGVRLTPGQRTGNKYQQAAETTQSETIFGGSLADTFDQQGTEVRSALMKMAGFADDDIADGVIDRVTIGNAKDRFAERYAEALGDVPVELDTDAFEDAVSRVAKDNLALLPFEQKSTLTGVIEDFKGLVESDPIDGQTYQRIRSRLGALERQTAGSNGVISRLYGDLKGALDDTFAASAGDDVSAIKRAIDTDYRNFKVLEKAASSAGADVAGGEPTIRNIANKARNATKGGTTQFRDLADAAQNITTDRTPNSGTASRLLGLGAGASGLATQTGIRAGQAAGLGQGLSPTTAGTVATLQTGIGPSIYQAIAGTQNLQTSAEQEQERRQLLLQSFGRTNQQLQGGQQ